MDETVLKSVKFLGLFTCSFTPLVIKKNPLNICDVPDIFYKYFFVVLSIISVSALALS